MAGAVMTTLPVMIVFILFNINFLDH